MLAIPDPAIRGSFRETLRSRGFSQILETETADTIRHALGRDHVDLLVTTPQLGGSEMVDLLQSHRQSKLGPNPFTLIIKLVDHPTDERVRWAADSGADDVLQMSTRPEQLMTRIDGFAKGRKPFIVAHDYIGPCRRHVLSDREGGHAAIEVPNPVQWRVLVNGDAEAYQRSIVATSARINLHKVNRTAVYLDQLVEEIVAAHREGRVEDGRTGLARLSAMVADLTERIVSTPFAAGWELLESMGMLCRRMAKPDRRMRDGEIAILPQLTRYLGNLLGDEAISTASAEAWRQGLREADFSLI